MSVEGDRWRKARDLTEEEFLESLNGGKRMDKKDLEKAIDDTERRIALAEQARQYHEREIERIDEHIRDMEASMAHRIKTFIGMEEQ